MLILSSFEYKKPQFISITNKKVRPSNVQVVKGGLGGGAVGGGAAIEFTHKLVKMMPFLKSHIWKSLSPGGLNIHMYCSQEHM